MRGQSKDSSHRAGSSGSGFAGLGVGSWRCPDRQHQAAATAHWPFARRESTATAQSRIGLATETNFEGQRDLACFAVQANFSMSESTGYSDRNLQTAFTRHFEVVIGRAAVPECSIAESRHAATASSIAASCHPSVDLGCSTGS